MEKVKEPICNLAEIQVSYKPKVKASDRRKISSSNDAVVLFREIWSDSIEIYEEFYFLLLDRGNKVLGWRKLSQGGINGTVVDGRIIFAIALKGLACGIVLAHNHPSGGLVPSEQDKTITKKLKDQGKVHDITILDHVIITAESYFSFADDMLL